MDKENLPLYTVDAFTKHAFKGNGAAVCLLPQQQAISEDIKQQIAAEMNLSETAFISLLQDNDSFEHGKKFKLQWFTPVCEVPLCGHATLASAAVIFEVYGNKSETIEFETLSGMLIAKQLPDGKIQLTLPAYESKPIKKEEYEDLIKATTGSLPIKEVFLSTSQKLLIRLSDEITRKELEKFKPNFADMVSSSPNLKGAIVTLKGSDMDDCLDEDGNSFDFISRYFAPWVGINEDPVTGAAHVVLGPYWSKALKKTKLYACQCSSRSGNINIEVKNNVVALSGHAVIVIKGRIQF